MIVSIQYLRALAAFMVLLNHVAWKIQQRGGHLMDGFNVGEAGVDVFFVISGFIMCHVTTRNPVTVREFLRNRVVRIVPLYWILTTIAGCVLVVAPERINSSGGDTRVLESYLLLPTSGKYLVQAGWTLAYEFYFYSIFAVGLLLEPRLGRALVMATLVALAGIGALLPSAHPTWQFLGSDLLLEFSYGMALYVLAEKRVVRHGAIAALLIAIGIALLACANQSPDRRFLSTIRAVNYGVPALLICGGFVFLERWLKDSRIRWLEALGDSSYSLYLSHVFSIGALGLLLDRWPTTGAGAEAVIVLVMVATALAAGQACYRWVEHPTRMALKTRFGARSGAVTLPAPAIRVR